MKDYHGYALITGGSSGIGLAFANLLAKEGYPLVLVAQDKAKLKKAADELKKNYKVKVLTISVNLADPKSTDLIYNTLKKKKIHVGLLINNAGFGVRLDTFQIQDRKKTLDMIRVMCMSLTDLTYKFLPAMIKKGRGGIIFTSSLAAAQMGPNFVAYGASKAFSLRFGTNLHAELLGTGIDVLTVCPGVIETDFWKRVGVKSLPSYIKMRSPYLVAEPALKALGKKIVIFAVAPPERVFLFLGRFLPLSWLEAIAIRLINKVRRDIKKGKLKKKT